MRKALNMKCCSRHFPGLLLAILFLFSADVLVAQPPPPKKVTITATAQGLSFGAFTHGPAGGTVSVNASGTRSSSGSVILLGMGYSFTPALFNLTGSAGTSVNITLGPDVSLTGSSGGSMTLHLVDINSATPATLQQISPTVLLLRATTTAQFRVGGSLVVGSSASNPPGSYSGTFTIIFNLQ
ncbi:MAG TPA: DUF4402 domain-containing protein [Bacteroidales bacterium]|nr:DUF4402 domain-containing protein [Bacteroidales bacterium]